MKCELCKCNLNFSQILCDSCAEAIRRLVRITNELPESQPQRHKIAGAAA